MRNITISAWNSTNIIFMPQNCNGTGWPVSLKERGSGYYRSCTSPSPSSATLSFRGSAVYYFSTYFDDQTIEISLDGAIKTDIQLSPPNGISENSNATVQVIWYIQDLQEVDHILELSPANNGSTLSVDTIVFTTNETIAPSSSPPIVTTPTSSATSALNASGTRIGLDNQTIGLIVGTVAGSISGLILLGLVVMMCRRKRTLRDMRRYHSFSTGSSRSPFNNSVQQRTQQSQGLTGHSYEQISIAKSPEPARTLPAPQQAGSSTARHLVQSPYSHVEVDPPEEYQWRSEAMDRSNQRTVNHTSPNVNYKLEPLRKASIRS